MPAMIRLTLFDNDGTLSDSIPTCRQATNKALAGAELNPVSMTDIAKGMRLETVLRMMEHAGTDDRRLGEELAVSFYDHWEAISDETQIFPGIPDLLDVLADSGMLLGIVSNNRSDAVTRVMNSGGIMKYFPLIIGEDNADEPKPAPGGLLQACRTLGVSPVETVYIGDGPSDPLAARAAGITSIGVRWNTHDVADITAMGFDHLIARPEELPELLARM